MDVNSSCTPLEAVILLVNRLSAKKPDPECFVLRDQSNKAMKENPSQERLTLKNASGISKCDVLCV